MMLRDDLGLEGCMAAARHKSSKHGFHESMRVLVFRRMRAHVRKHRSSPRCEQAILGDPKSVIAGISGQACL